MSGVHFISHTSSRLFATMKIYINRTYALKDLNQAQADLSSADKAIINIVVQKVGGFFESYPLNAIDFLVQICKSYSVKSGSWLESF